MNKRYFFTAAMALLAASGCTKLDVPVESQLTSANFPNSAESYVASTGTIYLKFSSQTFAVDFWRMNELTTDEAIIPNRNGGYYDNGIYIKWHKHTWTSDDVSTGWTWGYSGISQCNQVLNLLNQSTASDLRAASLAEVRTVRALFYFYMMDMYGKVPITTYGAKDSPKQSTRAEVFAYIESELLACVPDLAAPATVTATYYGRATRWMAYALLQKLYLNAEYYIGTKKYAEAIEYGNKLMTESSLQLESNYMSLFSPTNGPNSETIFAASFDATKQPGNFFTRYSLHGTLAAKYGLNFTPSNAMCTTPEFYGLFDLPGDARDTTWIAGLQYGFDKSTPIMNGGSQLNLTPQIVLTDESTMNVGAEVGGVSCGARSVKFYPDPNSVSRYQNNDIPVLRLADVYLMQAEAILRNDGNVDDAVALVNKVRDRVHAPEVSSITLDALLDERGRELAWEGWRRNDLIRFGKFEGKWGFKAGGEAVSRRLFPIPTTELVLNANLVQNDGY